MLISEIWEDGKMKSGLIDPKVRSLLGLQRAVDKIANFCEQVGVFQRIPQSYRELEKKFYNPQHSWPLTLERLVALLSLIEGPDPERISKEDKDALITILTEILPVADQLEAARVSIELDLETAQIKVFQLSEEEEERRTLESN